MIRIVLPRYRECCPECMERWFGTAIGVQDFASERHSAKLPRLASNASGAAIRACSGDNML